MLSRVGMRVNYGGLRLRPAFVPLYKFQGVRWACCAHSGVVAVQPNNTILVVIQRIEKNVGCGVGGTPSKRRNVVSAPCLRKINRKGSHDGDLVPKHPCSHVVTAFLSVAATSIPHSRQTARTEPEPSASQRLQRGQRIDIDSPGVIARPAILAPRGPYRPGAREERVASSGRRAGRKSGRTHTLPAPGPRPACARCVRSL